MFYFRFTKAIAYHSLGIALLIFMAKPFYGLDRTMTLFIKDTLFVCTETQASWQIDNTGRVVVQKPARQENSQEYSWSFTDPLPHKRSKHQTFPMVNGDLMVVGGYTMVDNDKKQLQAVTHPDVCLVFDAETHTWNEGVSMNVGREVGYASTHLSNGNFILIGGNSIDEGELTDAEIYDADAETFFHTADLAHHRRGHDAVEIPGGKVLVAGGTDGHGSFFNSSEIYDPETNSWHMPESTFDTARSLGRLAQLEDGNILYVGGTKELFTRKQADLFDPETETWTPAKPMLNPRQQFSIAELPNGRIIVIGGISIQDGNAYKSTEIYDPATNEWITGPTLNQAKVDASMITMQNGNLLIAGGQNCQGVEYLDIESMQWIRLPDMKEMRFWHSLDLLPDGNLMTIGGSYGWNVLYESAELFPLFYASIQLHTDTIDFGDLIPDESAMENLVITNPEPRFGVIEEITVSCNDFSVTGLETPFVLAPGEDLSVDIVYHGRGSFEEIGEVLTIKVDKGDHEEIHEVFLTGRIELDTSVDEIGSEDSDIEIFPNPAREVLIIQSPNVLDATTLLTPEGREVFHVRSGSKKQELNIAEFDPGVYLLQISSPNGNSVHKVMISQ